MALVEHYPDGVIDLGDYVRLRFTQHTGAADYSGAILEHPVLPSIVPVHSGGVCMGSIWFAGDGHGHPEWTVRSESPLTLEPSLLCHCGFHGFVREGRWVAV